LDYAKERDQSTPHSSTIYILVLNRCVDG